MKGWGLRWLGLGLCLLGLFGARLAFAADPLIDTDGDGVPDIWETTVYHTDPTKADTNGDGLTDREDIIRGLSATGTGKLVESDFDKDGLSDRLELLFGTDPTNPDTDSDGFKDGAEVFNGFSPTSTQPMTLPKSIAIHLHTHTLELRVMNIPIIKYLISDGTPVHPTPIGVFKVLNKFPKAWSRSAGLWMPWWMAFSGRGHGIHELPIWPSGYREGVGHLGHAVSHGCVRLGIGPAKLVYDWTPVGTPVIVTKN